MEKINKFYDKNKKIVILVAIILILLIAIGVYFISQPNGNTDKKVENQTEEKVDISQDNKKEEDKVLEESKVEEAPVDTSIEQPKDDSSNKPSNNNNTENSENSSNSSSSNNSDNSSSKPSTPTHTHSWKDHTATKKVWVSKIVPVYKEEPMYEERPVYDWRAYWTCNGCEKRFETEDDVLDHVLFECGTAYSVHEERVQTGTEKVQVGTNKVQIGTRDDGQYEIETYVDYQYCDCGAKK